MSIRLVVVVFLATLLSGCVTTVSTEVHTYRATPTGFLSHQEKRRAAVDYYGYNPRLYRSEIVGSRHRVTERMLLRHYRSTPHDVMCFRHYVSGNSRAILCSSDYRLSHQLRAYHRGYERRARLTLMPEHHFFADPVYTTFRLW